MLCLGSDAEPAQGEEGRADDRAEWTNGRAAAPRLLPLEVQPGCVNNPEVPKPGLSTNPEATIAPSWIRGTAESW